MWQRQIPTRYGLWAALTLALFVAAGCVNWIPEGKGVPYWAEWAIFLSGEYGCSTGEFVFALTGGACLLAVPSAILGWVGQAVAGFVLVAVRGQLTAAHQAAEPGAAVDGPRL